MDTNPGEDATVKNTNKLDLSQPQTLEIWAEIGFSSLHLGVNTHTDIYPYDGVSFDDGAAARSATLEEIENELTSQYFFSTCLDTGERLRVHGWLIEEIEIVGPLANEDN